MGREEGRREGVTQLPLSSKQHEKHRTSKHIQQHTCKKKRHNLPNLNRNTISKIAPYPTPQNGRGHNRLTLRGCLLRFSCPPRPHRNP